MIKNNVRSLRIDKGITQLELARILNVSRVYLGRLENGTINIGLKLAFKLSLFFDKPITEIFLFEDGV